MKSIRLLLPAVLAAALLVAAVPRALASPITLGFDEIQITEFMGVPDGYGGLIWNYGFAAIWYPDSPAIHGIVSRPNAVFNEDGFNPIINSPSPFSFISADLTGWPNPMSLTITGKLFGNTVDTTTLNLGTSPTLETFNWQSVNELDFDAGGNYFVMDNFTFNPTPEPATLWLMLGGLLCLGAVQWRRRAAA